MKHDQDAFNIIKGIKTIYLLNQKSELVYTMPIISESFQPGYDALLKGTKYLFISLQREEAVALTLALGEAAREAEQGEKARHPRRARQVQ